MDEQTKEILGILNAHVKENVAMVREDIAESRADIKALDRRVASLELSISQGQGGLRVFGWIFGGSVGSALTLGATLMAVFQGWFTKGH